MTFRKTQVNHFFYLEKNTEELFEIIIEIWTRGIDNPEVDLW